MPPPAAARRPRRTQAERSAATQALLLDAAARVVLTKSFRAATMFEVAKEAGVTPGALQHHFGSKAELMLRLLERELDAQGEGKLAWPAADGPLSRRVRAVVQTLWSTLYEPPRFLVAWGVYFGGVGDEPLRRRIVAERARLQGTLHERFIASLPELRRDPAASAYTDMVLSCLRGIGIARLFDPMPKACAAQLQALAGAIELHCAALLGISIPSPAGAERTGANRPTTRKATR